MKSNTASQWRPQFCYPLGDENDDHTKWTMFTLLKEDNVQLVIENISDPEHRSGFEAVMCSIRDQLSTGLEVGECVINGRTISKPRESSGKAA